MITALLIVVVLGGIVCFWMLVGIASDNTEIMNALALIALRRDLLSGSVTDDANESATYPALSTGIHEPAGTSRASQPAGSDATPCFDELECPVCYGTLDDCTLCRGTGSVLVYEDSKGSARLEGPGA